MDDTRRTSHPEFEKPDFAYETQPKLEVRICHLCGGAYFTVVSKRDRYGFPARASLCNRCGLGFLDTVMTQEAYASFYASVYRPLVSFFHQRRIDAETIKVDQRSYAKNLADLIRPYVDDCHARSLLDIGGSTGVVALDVASAFGMKATVVDPSPAETAEARRSGLTVIQGMIEEIEFGYERYDLVLLCQTVDHLLDVAGTLRKIRSIISKGGLLFLDIVDWESALRLAGCVEVAIKIDHPYYFTEGTIEALLARSGLRPLRKDYPSDGLHVGYVCDVCKPDAAAMPSSRSVERLLSQIRCLKTSNRRPR